jgi:hypothetical protein
MTRLPDAIKGRIAAKPLVTMVEIAEVADRNPYGWKEIHIYAFNVDGRGFALVSYDDELQFDYCHTHDIGIILAGDPGDGWRWYRPKGKAGAAEAKKLV